MNHLKRRLSHVSNNEFRDWLTREHEIGGSVETNQNGAISFIPQSMGSTDWTIKIPSSPIMFHTHPLGCPDEQHNNLCGYGVPSARDIGQFLKEKHSRAHAIIAHDGVYLMENRCSDLLKRKQDEHFVRRIHELETSNKQSENGTNAQQYHRKWWNSYNEIKPSCVKITYYPYKD